MDYRSLSTGHAHCEVIAWVQLTVWIYRPDVYETVTNSKCSNIQKSFQRRRDKLEDLPCRAIKALVIAKSSGIMHDWLDKHAQKLPQGTPARRSRLDEARFLSAEEIV